MAHHDIRLRSACARPRLALPVRLCLLLPLALLSDASEAAADVCFTVQYRFTFGAPTHLLARAMQTEASAIWSPHGVRLIATGISAPADCAQVEGSFEVVIEHRSRPRIGAAGGLVLGSTRLNPGWVDRAPIRIDYAATEKTINVLPRDHLVAVARTHRLGSSEIGRALGRVLAHEIGHVLLAVRGHQSRGLMRDVFRPGDLVALGRSSFTLSLAEVNRLRGRPHNLGVTARAGISYQPE